MKKFLFIISIYLFVFSNSYGDIFSNDKNKMMLFGIALGENRDSVESTPCYEYKGVLNVKKLDSMKFKETRDWKTLIYTESKFPVTEGCVKPLINNDEFFNFKIYVYPKSNEIYKISAVYKKTFIHSLRELAPPFIPDENLRKTGWPSFGLFDTECHQLATSLEGIVFETHKAKGFKKEYRGRIIKGNKNKPKYKFYLNSTCDVNGVGRGLIEVGHVYNINVKETYFVTIQISNEVINRISNEKNEIRDEAAKKDLNKSGL
jgi:hypothetical protein